MVGTLWVVVFEGLNFVILEAKVISWVYIFVLCSPLCI